MAYGMEQVDSGLRYIGAEDVEIPAGRLAGAMLVSPQAETVGSLDGIVIDPVGRHLRFFVVRPHASIAFRRHLVPATAARLDSEHKALHMEIEPGDLARFPEVRSDTFPPYSDEDLIAALFPPRAA